MAENQNIQIDVDGTDKVSEVLLDLLNEYPELKEDEKITFSTLEDTGGIGFFPSSGSVLLENKKSITGHIKQKCQYPFTLVYRFAPKATNAASAKLKVKEFLDNIGKWLELQPIKVGDEIYKLESYPELQCGNRKIESISRTNASHLSRVYDDKIEDWIISLKLIYKNEYNL